MAIKELETIQFDDEKINRMQNFIKKFCNQFLNRTIIDGLQVSINLSNGVNSVNHGLGRKPNGFIVVAKSGNVDIWGTAFTEKTLTLSTSGAVSGSIWVF